MSVVSSPSTGVIVSPVNMSVVPSVAIVRAENVSAGDVVLWVTASIRQNPLARMPPLRYLDWLGRGCSIIRADIARVIGFGALLWGDVCIMSPIHPIGRIRRPTSTLVRPGLHRIHLTES